MPVGCEKQACQKKAKVLRVRCFLCLTGYWSFLGQQTGNTCNWCGKRRRAPMKTHTAQTHEPKKARGGSTTEKSNNAALSTKDHTDSGMF